MELPRKALPHVCHPRRVRRTCPPLWIFLVLAMAIATWPASLTQGYAPNELLPQRPASVDLKPEKVVHFEERLENANLFLKDFFRHQDIGSKDLLSIRTSTEGVLYEASFFISPYSRKTRLERALNDLIRTSPRSSEVQVSQVSPAETLWVVNISIDERHTHEITFYFSAPSASLPAPKHRASRSFLGRVALVFDDLGDSREALDDLLSLPAPLTLSFLPDTPHGPSTLPRKSLQGKEVFLHVPMEPKDPEAVNATNFLLMGMSDREVTETLRKQLARCTLCTGFNNHMGSRVTTDVHLMKEVMGVAKERHVMFLDSRTTNETVGFSTALQMGVATAMRDVFLDHDPSPRAIEHQFQMVRRIARAKGQAIAIGHPHASTLRLVRSEIARLRQEGYELVTVSQLKKGTNNEL